MTEQEEIEVMEERFAAAIQRGSVACLEELLNDQMLFIDRNGQVKPYSQDLEIYRSGNLDIKNIDVCDKQINLAGNIAVVMAIEKIQGKYRGRDFEGRYLYMRVWKKVGRCWKISAASCSAIPVVEFSVNTAG